MLCNPCIQVAFPYPDQVGSECQSQGQKNVGNQRPHVSSNETFINDLARQNGRKQRTYGRDGDTHKHQCKLLPVGSEITENPDQKRPCHFRPVLFLLFRQKSSAHRASAALRHGHSPPFSDILHPISYCLACFAFSCSLFSLIFLLMLSAIRFCSSVRKRWIF